MRLTDEQVREIKDENVDWSLGSGHIRDNVDRLLDDREALLAEIAYNITQNTELVRELASLKSENAKLRKGLIDAKPILEGFAVENPRWPKLCNGDVVMQDPAGVFSLLSFIDTLEPTNVPDATDDKG